MNEKTILIVLIINWSCAPISSIKDNSPSTKAPSITSPLKQRDLQGSQNSVFELVSNAGSSFIPQLHYVDVNSLNLVPASHLLYSAQTPPRVDYVPPAAAAATIFDANPFLTALLLSASLGIPPKATGFNHPDHVPLNPYIALLLSQYGRYLPVVGKGHHFNGGGGVGSVGGGLYSYAASNNYHNNKPFGAYKIYEDQDS